MSLQVTVTVGAEHVQAVERARDGLRVLVRGDLASTYWGAVVDDLDELLSIVRAAQDDRLHSVRVGSPSAPRVVFPRGGTDRAGDAA